MADSHTQTPHQQPQIQTPLLPPPPSPPPPPPLQNNTNHLNHHHNHHLPDQEADVDQSIAGLELLLTFLGFSQSSVPSYLISWTVFVLIGVLLPVIILELPKCSGCDKYQIKDFELEIVASQACLAAVSLGCISRNIRKYGVRKFIFVDRRNSLILGRFSHQYAQQIKNSLRLLIVWSLPCFILKVVREVIRISYVKHESRWLSAAILFGLIVSWSYVSTITLTASIIFHLVCNLQIIHFDDYEKLLERESDVLLFIEEHIRLRYHLSKISHRFRIFLLLQFCSVTASQIVTLFQTTGYSGIITVINGGDFAVSSVVQVVGISLCLHAATKISHRAQRIASVVSRWHALATCGSGDSSHLRVSYSSGSLETVNSHNSLSTTYSESDLESMDYVAMPTNTQLVSYMSSYHRRQSFVMYLQNNPGGITIFGWTVDRGLINTIFFIQLTLITFVLGKTIVFASK
ncbi:uncharacterized protein LOC126655234 [Mercurialis annua]|uniref:uncharacterized protein LOC126655234 n=1 Tax=Mercurialis annua TaxID=3986 RepID=UPI00215F6364|nr:uncharacterized protein LOC126655234 [Mercurialis annua]